MALGDAASAAEAVDALSEALGGLADADGARGSRGTRARAGAVRLRRASLREARGLALLRRGWPGDPAQAADDFDWALELAGLSEPSRCARGGRGESTRGESTRGESACRTPVVT